MFVLRWFKRALFYASNIYELISVLKTATAMQLSG